MNLPDRLHRIHLELRFDGMAPTGQASLEGGDPRAVSGWVGLVRAVEELVTEDREPLSTEPGAGLLPQNLGCTSGVDRDVPGGLGGDSRASL